MDFIDEYFQNDFKLSSLHDEKNSVVVFSKKKKHLHTKN